MLPVGGIAGYKWTVFEVILLIVHLLDALDLLLVLSTTIHK